MHSEVGAVAFVVDYGLFLAVFLAFARPYIASMLGICAGIAVSFTLNSRYSVQRRDAVIKRATKFVGGARFGMARASALPQNPMVPHNAPAANVLPAALIEISYTRPFTGTV